MNKIIILVSCFIAITIGGIKAQNNTQSPYSKLGLGDFQNTGFGRNAAMGGLGYALSPNNELNLQNPASLANLDSMQSLLNIGVQGGYSYIENKYTSDGRVTANITNLSYGMSPSDKFAFAFGISPYTNVGYEIQIEQQISGSNETYDLFLEGSGGLSTVYLCGGYKLGKNISLGLNIGFLFGPKDELLTYEFSDTYDVSISQEISDRYNGWIFDLGYQQKFNIGKNHRINLGVVANLPSKLNHTQTNSVVAYFNDLGTSDTVTTETETESKITFPVNIGAGLAYTYKNKWLVNADYSLKRWSETKIDDEFTDLIDNHIMAFGVEYSPKRKRMNSAQIKYRLGANMQSGYYQIESQNLGSYNLTAGVGFTIRKAIFNFYGSYGWRGFKDSQYLSEKTVKFGINMTLSEMWFKKQKYN